jgi:integrase/recombinase XerD
MRKTPALQRFDAAASAYISSRRALGRAIRLDEYVLHRLRSYLARAGHTDLDAASFARWRRLLRHCAYNTQIDWTMMVYRFCRYRRRRESRCFLPQRLTLGRRRPYSLPTPITDEQVRRLLRFVAACPPIAGRPLSHAAHRLAIVLLYTAGLRRGEAARLWRTLMPSRALSVSARRSSTSPAGCHSLPAPRESCARIFARGRRSFLARRTTRCSFVAVPPVVIAWRV